MFIITVSTLVLLVAAWIIAVVYFDQRLKIFAELSHVGKKEIQEETFRKTLLIFVCSVIGITGIAMTAKHITTKIDLSETKTRANLEVAIAGRLATHDFETIAATLHVLAEDKTLMALLDDKSEEARQEVTEEFLTTARETKLFDQIRLLDIDGMEVVRVDFHNGNPTTATARAGPPIR